jgi:hypothetical protein
LRRGELGKIATCKVWFDYTYNFSWKGARVDRKELSANFHLIPLALVYNFGFQTRELRKWPMLNTDNQKELLKARN